MACSLLSSLFMRFLRQEYWSGFPFPSSGDLPNREMESGSPVMQVDSLPTGPPGKTICVSASQILNKDVKKLVKNPPTMQET